MPQGQRSLLQRAERLARQAADLEEEAKRKEAQAFYLIREADQLEGERAGLARAMPRPLLRHQQPHVVFTAAPVKLPTFSMTRLPARLQC